MSLQHLTMDLLLRSTGMEYLSISLLHLPAGLLHLPMGGCLQGAGKRCLPMGERLRAARPLRLPMSLWRLPLGLRLLRMRGAQRGWAFGYRLESDGTRMGKKLPVSLTGVGLTLPWFSPMEAA